MIVSPCFGISVERAVAHHIDLSFQARIGASHHWLHTPECKVLESMLILDADKSLLTKV